MIGFLPTVGLPPDFILPRDSATIWQEMIAAWESTTENRQPPAQVGMLTRYDILACPEIVRRPVHLETSSRTCFRDGLTDN